MTLCHSHYYPIIKHSVKSVKWFSEEIFIVVALSFHGVAKGTKSTIFPSNFIYRMIFIQVYSYKLFFYSIVLFVPFI